MMDEIEEKLPFIQHTDVLDQRSPNYSIPQKSTIILFFILLLSNGLWWINYAHISKEEDCVRPKLIFSPAAEYIRYEKKILWRSIEPDNIYAGDPRVEHDQAWKELIKPMAIKLSPEELAQLGEPSIAFKDGSGYLAEMAVYHELHCIKRIRRHLHLAYYYGNLTNDEDFSTREKQHMDHCLEYWREAAMCRGDPTLTTFVWKEGKPFSKVHSTHECVNWDLLRQWSESRMVDTSDLSVLSRSSGHDEGWK